KKTAALSCLNLDVGAVAEPSQEVVAVLPTQAVLGHVCQAKPTHNITQEPNVGILKLSVHHGTFGPVHQLSLGEAALQMGRKLFGDSLACDFHPHKLHVLMT